MTLIFLSSLPHFEKCDSIQKMNILALKDGTKPFPEQRVGVLRWGLKTTDESFLPLNLTCWSEEIEAGKINVNIEYTLQKRDMKLLQVEIINH